MYITLSCGRPVEVMDLVVDDDADEKRSALETYEEYLGDAIFVEVINATRLRVHGIIDLAYSFKV